VCVCVCSMIEEREKEDLLIEGSARPSSRDMVSLSICSNTLARARDSHLSYFPTV